MILSEKEAIEICKMTYRYLPEKSDKCCWHCAHLAGRTLSKSAFSCAIPSCNIHNSVIREDVMERFSGTYRPYEIDSMYGLACTSELRNMNKAICDLFEPVTNNMYLTSIGPIGVDWLLHNPLDITKPEVKEWLNKPYDFTHWAEPKENEE